MRLIASIFVSFICSVVAIQSVSACPLQAGLVDFNCDGIQKIAFVGDSFVNGLGDTTMPGGGYFARIANNFPGATVVRYGVSGVTSARLLSLLKRRVRDMATGAPENNLIGSDILILDVGRNDFYTTNNPPETVKTIKLIVKYLQTELASRGDGIAPVIAVASLFPTTRLNQRFFIVYASDIMIAQKSSTLPLFIRLEKLAKTLVSKDGLHPTSAGYTKIARIIQRYITTKSISRALALRPDNDADGVYDLFESSTFGTSTSSSDTDGDGFSDLDEIFVHLTNPTDSAAHP